MEFVRAESFRLDVEADGSAYLWIDLPNRSYNVINRRLLTDLDAALDRLEDHSNLGYLVLAGRKGSGFLAGADLYEFAAIQYPEEAAAASEFGQRVFNKLAALRVPTVAVIHGPCLGGGLELALACDYRIVLDLPGTQLGLPEIELGLVPGWGGTQRLPCVVGLERALRIIVGRQRLNAPDALSWGLADEVQARMEDAAALILHRFGPMIRGQGKRPKTSLPLRTWRQRLVESNALGRALIFRGAERLLQRRVPDDMPAPFEALKAVRTGLMHGMEAGLAYERDAISRLALTRSCRNLMTIFFLMDRSRSAASSRPARGTGCQPVAPAGTLEAASRPTIRRVGVVGGGTMGAGIAQLAALKGFQVVLQEIDDRALAAGLARIDALFRKAVERRLLSEDDARMKREAIAATTSWQGFDQADLVIEAVVEDRAIKQAVFAELDRRTRPDALLATNTSSLSVGQLQEGLTRPQRVGGLHFFNPVHKMMLVEVVRAPATTDDAADRLMQFAAQLGKTPVLVRDSPGFIVNRILIPYLNEAGILVADGMPVDRVDQAMRRFGMPLGPLELLDQVGLDVAMHIARSVGRSFGERLQPHPALEKMCQTGWLGQKTGKGFYVYSGRRRRVHHRALQKLRFDLSNEERQAMEIMAPSQQMQEAADRMVCMMVNEAAACLGEGLADRADVIDLAMVLGTGWAPHRGGPLRYADDRGEEDILRVLDDHRERFGPRFEPCDELRRRAETGEPFYGPMEVPQPV